MKTIEDQAFATVAMGFRRMELGLAQEPIPLNGFHESRRETGIEVRSMVIGCLDSRSSAMTGTRLGSLDIDDRAQALLSCRRHIRIAAQYECPIVILRGSQVENPKLSVAADELHNRLVESGPDEGLVKEIAEHVAKVARSSQSQIDHFCRGIHKLIAEFPGVTIAVESGMHYNDLFSYETTGWMLEDLAKQGLRYWHDSGRVYMRERAGLPPQGQWLDSFANCLVGAHIHDSDGVLCEMPPGKGDVDFKLLAEYLPKEAEKVIEVNSRHPRAEILAAVQTLNSYGI
ncbi:MAG: TIM barrel protein [Planctomycetota bacterium]|nr:TIM barrel protein [Planctomycetota bacterium]